MIDLRSDTVTKPTSGMLKAMTNAEVGDDVHHGDPTVKKLEKRVAEYFGKEAALFCPSGTMTNQIGLFLYGGPGKEFVIEKNSHVYFYECGGLATHARSSVHLLSGERGKIRADQVEMAVNPPDDIHRARTCGVILENTTNRGGGACYELNEIKAIRRACDEKGLILHLDGARVWNALVAKDQNPVEVAEPFDSVSVCLSKGLGAPVGSLLIGDKNFIEEARFVRKAFGGGMRQAGFMAAAGLYAFENQLERLEEDHAHAKRLEGELHELPWVHFVSPVETNIVIFETSGELFAAYVGEKLAEKGILCSTIAENKVRLVTHLDVSSREIDEVCTQLRQLV